MTTRTGIFTDTGGSQYQFWAGVLRNTTGTWQILGTPPSGGIADATHQSSNLWTVTQDGSAVYVTGPASHKMMSFIVATDETFAQMGLFVGASVISGQATVKMARVDPTSPTGVSNTNPNDPALITEFGNLWIEGWFLL